VLKPLPVENIETNGKGAIKTNPRGNTHLENLISYYMAPLPIPERGGDKKKGGRRTPRFKKKLDKINLEEGPGLGK